jgi:serine protease inhibitor
MLDDAWIHEAMGSRAGLRDGRRLARGARRGPRVERIFGLDIRRAGEGGAGNLAVSPYSIANALSMALAGARGGTAEEMAKVLGQSAVDAKYHAELAALVGAIRKAGNAGGNRFLDANALWVQKGFRILPEFTRSATA